MELPVCCEISLYAVLNLLKWRAYKGRLVVMLSSLKGINSSHDEGEDEYLINNLDRAVHRCRYKKYNLFLWFVTRPLFYLCVVTEYSMKRKYFSMFEYRYFWKLNVLISAAKAYQKYVVQYLFFSRFQKDKIRSSGYWTLSPYASNTFLL